VDQIFLEGIPAKLIHRNAFRGLSFCKNLYLTNSHIQEIEENAFHRTNNINKLNLMNSKLKTIHNNAFNGAFNIHTIDLRGNYLTSINKTTFGELIMPNLDYLNEMNQRFKLENDSIILLDNINPSEKYVKKILFDQNPIQCDCSLGWLLNKKMYSESITFPEICAGPKGYDCLRISDITIDSLPCNDNNELKPTNKVPCEDLVFEVQKDTDIYSLSVPKGKNKNEDENNNSNNDDQNHTEDYYNENNYLNYDANYYDENKEQFTTPQILSASSSTADGPKPMTTTAHLIKTKSSSVSNTLEFLSNNFLSNQLSTTTAKTMRNTKLTTPVIKTTKSAISNKIIDNHNGRNLNSEDFSSIINNSSLNLYNSGSSNFKFNFLINNYFYFSKAFLLLINLNLFVFITLIYFNL
jgi:hypothetical protein